MLNVYINLIKVQGVISYIIVQPHRISLYK